LLLGVINYRGIRQSAKFQQWTTSVVLLIFAFLLILSGSRGSSANFHPLFSTTPLVSILLTIQIVPYFLTGFESVPKVAEESHPDFAGKNYFRAIALALLTGAFFYVFTIGAVSYIHPWQSLLGRRFATAIAFEQALSARWPIQLILVMATFGLVQCFNGNFVASTRLLFAFARRGTIPASFAAVHEQFLTPHIAVLGLSIATLVGLLLGDAILVPVTEVGSMASATGWFLACLSFLCVEQRTVQRVLAALGLLVALALIAMKVIPAVPGHFTRPEWIALSMWLAIGAVMRLAARMKKKQQSN